MAWNNQDLILYHGCDNESVDAIIQNGIQLNRCKPHADFGRGFYTTTSLHQAKNWANVRCRRLRRARSPYPVFATVLRFDVKRDELAERAILCFVTENSNPDYWEFIEFCRQGHFALHGHNRKGSIPHYSVVFGPVSLWPQTIVVKDCDQMSFHDRAGLQVLQGPDLLLRPTKTAQATPENP